MNIFISSLFWRGEDGQINPMPLFNSIIQAPDVINAVVGDTLQVFYTPMIATPYSFYMRINCPIGNNYFKINGDLRYFEVTPIANNIGNHPFKIQLLREDYSIIEEKVIVLNVSEAVQSPSESHFSLVVGDSNSDNGAWSNEMIRRLTSLTGVPLGNGFSNITLVNEAIAGWYWESFQVNETSPFVESGVFSFETWRVNNGYSFPKSVYIMLTWNGMAAMRIQSEWDSWDNWVYSFLDKLKSDFPNSEVILIGVPILSGIGGTGAAGASNSLSDWFEGMINAKKQSEIYKRITKEAGYEHIRFIDASVHIDNEYNVAKVLKNVNTRNSDEQEWIGTNSNHPPAKAYDQIADMTYRDFVANYCQKEGTSENKFLNQYFTDSNSDGIADNINETIGTLTIGTGNGHKGNYQKVTNGQCTININQINIGEEVVITFRGKGTGDGDCWFRTVGGSFFNVKLVKDSEVATYRMNFVANANITKITLFSNYGGTNGTIEISDLQVKTI